MLDFHSGSMNATPRDTANGVPTENVRKVIVACVSRDSMIDPAKIDDVTRGSPKVAHARQVAMYLAHVVARLNFKTLGILFRRDRTTVAHACRAVEDRRDDVEFDRRISTLEAECSSLLAGECR